MDFTSDQNITTNTNNPATLTTINPTTPNTSEVTDEDIRRIYTKLSTVMKHPLSTDEVAWFKEKDPTAQHIKEYIKLHIKLQLEHIGALPPSNTTKT